MRLSVIIVILYIAVAASAQQHKMSSFVRHAVDKHVVSTAKKGKSNSPAKQMTVLVRCTDDEEIQRNGGCILASFDNDIRIISIPITQLSPLSFSASVSRIEANGLCTVHTDTARIFANVLPVWDTDYKGTFTCSPELAHPYTGKGVVVGVQDIGFDLTHPVFFSRDGQEYHIKRFWDMLDPDRSDSSLPVGRDYLTEEEILAKAHATDGYIMTHGTHTTSIAAGSGYNTTLIGVAPDADICLVANAVSGDEPVISEEDEAKYTTATDLLGFKYIFDYAESVGKPCVINFSEGSHQDFYDNILYDEVLGQLIGPGRIIVASAGNEGHKLSYLARSEGQYSVRSLYHYGSPQAALTFRAKEKAKIKVLFDALGEQPYEYIISTDEMVEDSIYADTIDVHGTPIIIDKVFYDNCYEPGKSIGGELYFHDTVNKIFGGSSMAACFIIEGEDNDTELFYYAGEFYDDSRLPSDAQKNHNIHFPAASEHVLCVGASNSRKGFFNYQGIWQGPYWGELYEYSGYSSVGPSHSNLIKPDILAPGTYLTSAYSSYYLEEHQGVWDVDYFDYNGRTYTWHCDCGTSMSAPMVAGIIALWLEACPTLTLENIHETLQVTAKEVPGQYFEWKNNYCGYGSIDAFAGLKYVLSHFANNIDGIQKPISEMEVNTVSYFSIDGVKRATPQAGINIIRDADGVMRKILCK